MAEHFRCLFLRRLLQLFALAGLAAGAAITGASGQTTTQDVDRAQLFRNTPAFSADPYDPVTGSDSGHAASSPNDPDLGEQEILKRQERYRAFTASVSAPVFYTSNVALTRTAEKGDVVFAPGVAVGFEPHFTTTLFGTASVAQQAFYYNRFGDLDFESFDARVGLTYILPKLHGLNLHADYDFNRLTTDEFEHEFYTSHSLFFTAELPFRIGRAQQISLGADTNIVFAANPEPPRRHDFDVYVGYAANLSRSFTLAAVGRVALRDYVETNRTDVSEIIALTGTYRFNKWLSAAATSSLAASQSNHSAFDYTVGNIGAAVGLSLRF